MHTVLRYNRRGEKLFPVYWLVAQGHYKNKRGKHIEHLGYWIPKANKKKKLERSLILNKNRIRYWIAEGARLPYKAKRHMSFFGLSNEPWIKWGRKTTSPSGEKEFDIRREAYGEFDTFNLDKEEAQRLREANIENMLLRRVKLKQRLIEEFQNLGQEEILENLLVEEDSLEDNEDIMLRSSKYWLLYEEYERIEKNPNMIHPMRKELVFKKLNEFAEKGFVGRDRIAFDNPFFSIFNKQRDTIKLETHADHLKRAIDSDKSCKI